MFQVKFYFVIVFKCLTDSFTLPAYPRPPRQIPCAERLLVKNDCVVRCSEMPASLLSAPLLLANPAVSIFKLFSRVVARQPASAWLQCHPVRAKNLQVCQRCETRERNLFLFFGPAVMFQAKNLYGVSLPFISPTLCIRQREPLQPI